MLGKGPESEFRERSRVTRDPREAIDGGTEPENELTRRIKFLKLGRDEIEEGMRP